MKLTNVNCSAENAIRCLDNAGRVVIPKGLRDRVGLRFGDEMNFYFIESDELNLIGISKNDLIDPRYMTAKVVLEELGIEPPPALLDKIQKK